MSHLNGLLVIFVWAAVSKVLGAIAPGRLFSHPSEAGKSARHSSILAYNIYKPAPIRHSPFVWRPTHSKIRNSALFTEAEFINVQFR
jgi:hypothetical protein